MVSGITPVPTTIGRFRIESLIGSGGMGEVYKGTDPTLCRTVAIKTVRADRKTHESLERLYREAQACARLTHPKIVTVFEAGEIDGVLYIAMEYLQGENLCAALRSRDLPFEAKLRILIDVLDALQHAHANGVIHRDIKPSNVFRLPDGSIKLLDFGVARILPAEKLTLTGAVMGTPYYASPEQLKGEPVDARTDVYSTGALAYQMLSGRCAFEGEDDSFSKVALRVISEELAAIDVAWTRRFPQIERIVARAMAKAPGARYQSAAEMRDALQGFLDSSQPAIAEFEAFYSDALAETAASGGESTIVLRPQGLSASESTKTAATTGVVSSDRWSARSRWAAGGIAVLAIAVLAIAVLGAVLQNTEATTDQVAIPPHIAASPPDPPGPISGRANVGNAQAGHKATDTKPRPAADGSARAGESAPQGGAPPAGRGDAPAELSARDLFFSREKDRGVAGTAGEVPGHVPRAAGANAGLNYRVTRQTPDGSEMDVDPGVRFKSGDRVRFTFESNIDGYLYVAQLGSSGRWTVLFPNPDINEGRNTVKQFEKYPVPADGWFTFDSNPGTEQVFVFLSREPLDQLPGLERPVNAVATLSPSVVEGLQRSIRSRDLVFQKERTLRSATSPAPGQVTYVVNREAVGTAVSALISLHHDQ